MIDDADFQHANQKQDVAGNQPEAEGAADKTGTEDVAEAVKQSKLSS